MDKKLSSFLILLVILLFSLSTTVFAASDAIGKSKPDDSFLMEDFSEPVPEYVKEPVPTEAPVITKDEKTEQPAPAFSVKRRTYILAGYGSGAVAEDSWFNRQFQLANTDYKATTYGKGPYTLINSILTGGIEVRKGWNNNIMFGLSVFSSVGESPEKIIKVSGGELTGFGRYDISSTFVNVYFYAPISPTLEYYWGLGPGVSSGIIEWREESTKFIITDYENSFDAKGFGGQLFTGLDWRLFDNFLVELNLFYRGMDLKAGNTTVVSLSGGGANIGLVVAF